jgi:hypothetical protein
MAFDETSGDPAGEACGAMTARCERSEDGVLRLAFGRDFVTFVRRIAGLDMCVNVPTQSFRGVALQSLPDARFRIMLRHADPGLDVMLAEAEDDSDVIADWRLCGRIAGLPLLVEDAEGRVRALEPEPAQPAVQRRYGSPLKARRPRFLARRSMGSDAPPTASASV